MKNSEEYVFIDYKARLDEDTKIIKGISQWFLTEEFKISDFVNNVDTLFHYLRVDYYDAVTKKLKTLEEVNYWKPHHKEFIIGIKKNIKKIIIDMVREKNILATNTKVKSS